MASTEATTPAVISASPMPITVCTPTMAVNTRSKGTAAEAPNSHWTLNAIDDSTTEANAAMLAAMVTPVASRRQQAACAAEHGPATERGDHRHVEHVVAERGQPTVGERERLDDHDDADDEQPERRAEQHRSERTTEQVPGRAGRDREVHHLRGEHERGRDARPAGCGRRRARAGSARIDAAMAPALRMPVAMAVGAVRKPSGACMLAAPVSWDPATGIGLGRGPPRATGTVEDLIATVVAKASPTPGRPYGRPDGAPGPVVRYSPSNAGVVLRRGTRSRTPKLHPPALPAPHPFRLPLDRSRVHPANPSMPSGLPGNSP
jgi:hypothetical protein